MDLCCCVFRTLYYISEFGQIAYRCIQPQIHVASLMPAPLRIYPVPFAREVCDMLEEMKATRQGQPELPHIVPTAIETFGQLEMADPQIWRHVDLKGVYNYLRRSKNLQIPAQWLHLMPKKLEWGFHVGQSGKHIHDVVFFDFFPEKKKGWTKTRTEPIFNPF